MERKERIDIRVMRLDKGVNQVFAPHIGIRKPMCKEKGAGDNIPSFLRERKLFWERREC